MVVVTYRPQQSASQQRLKELKQDLLLRRLCAEIELAPLAKAALRQLLARELRQEKLPAELTEFVHRHSEGNPLFAIAVVEHLIAQGILVREGENGAARWEQRVPLHEMEAVLPSELAQMIDLEIERLSEDERRLLEAASLMSVAFPAWAVAAALEEDAAETEEKCDELARRLYFVNRAGEDELPNGTRSAFYVFAHELYREVLYRRQPVARRARRHIRIAERLGELFAGRQDNVAREMAMHYEAAGGWQHAARALIAAAGHARRREANSEAEELLQRALRLVENLGEMEREATAKEIRSELAELRERLTPLQMDSAVAGKKLDKFLTGT
jgi:predicted ATPase